MKRLGPELKMPKLKGGEMKVPPFLSDLYHDLRDRRLLPLVGLILVAIAATPILLGGGDEPEPAPVPAPIAGGSAPAADTLTVVKAEPGLRNYKKRLGHRSPTNPFHQRFTGPRLNGAHLNEPTTSTTTTTSSSSSTTTETSTPLEPTVTSPTSSEPSGPAPSGGGGGGGNGGNEELPNGLTLFTYALDVEITRIETKPDGTLDETGPTLHKEVLPPSPLPGEKAAVATYLGMGVKNELPLFLVSPEVGQTWGNGECVAGTLGSCQLLALGEGKTETLEYGQNHVRYKIKVVGVKPVVTGHS